MKKLLFFVILILMFTTAASLCQAATLKITIDADKMKPEGKIICKTSRDIHVFGTVMTSDTGLPVANANLTFSYGTTTIGTNTSDNSGNYNMTFSMAYEGNYTLNVTGSNTTYSGTNSSILLIRSRPEYVEYRMTYHLGTSNANNVYRLGTSSITNQTMNNTNTNNLQYSSNLLHYYICSYDNVDYANGMLLAMIHSYKGSYLDYVNFSSTSSNPDYTLEVRNKVEGSSLILAYTKGTCQLVQDKIQVVESQAIPSRSLAIFSTGTPSAYHYEIRAIYDKIYINGTDSWTTGTNLICAEKTAVSNNKPMVYVRRC